MMWTKISRFWTLFAEEDPECFVFAQCIYKWLMLLLCGAYLRKRFYCLFLRCASKDFKRYHEFDNENFVLLHRKQIRNCRETWRKACMCEHAMVGSERVVRIVRPVLANLSLSCMPMISRTSVFQRGAPVFPSLHSSSRSECIPLAPLLPYYSVVLRMLRDGVFAARGGCRIAFATSSNGLYKLSFSCFRFLYFPALVKGYSIG